MTDYYTHPTAIVETDDIGTDTSIWAMTHVMKNVSIGRECNIGDHCFVESGARIGNYVTIKNGNMVWDGVTLEDGVFVGPHAFFTNDLFPRSWRYPEIQLPNGEAREWFTPTMVRRGASLGAGSIIIAGVEIGEFAMIGAGAVITRDVPAHALMIGNPARVYRWVCQCGLPINFAESNEAQVDGDNVATCLACGCSYAKEDGSIRALEKAA